MVKTFDALFAELAAKAAERPEGSGTVAQLDAGVHAIGKKIVEEAAEVWMAAEYESTDAAAEEISQLLYHLQVLMLAKGLTPRGRLPTSLSAASDLRRSEPESPAPMLRIAVPNKGSLADTASEMLSRGRLHRASRPQGPPRHRPSERGRVLLPPPQGHRDVRRLGRARRRHHRPRPALRRADAGRPRDRGARLRRLHVPLRGARPDASRRSTDLEGARVATVVSGPRRRLPRRARRRGRPRAAGRRRRVRGRAWAWRMPSPTSSRRAPRSSRRASRSSAR